MAFPLVPAPHFVSVSPPMFILFPLLRKTEELHVVCELYLGYSELLGYYPLISEYILCVLLCDWVSSLRMIFSKSIHLPKNFMNSLFLIAK